MTMSAKKIASLYAEKMADDDHFAGRDWGINDSQGTYNAKPGYKEKYGSKVKAFLKDIGKDEIEWTVRDRKNYNMYWGAVHADPPRYIKYKGMTNQWVDVYCKRADRENGICAPGGKKKKANSALPADTLSPDVVGLLNQELARTCTHLRCSKAEVLNAVNSVLAPFGFSIVERDISRNVFSLGAHYQSGCFPLKGASLVLRPKRDGWGVGVE